MVTEEGQDGWLSITEAGERWASSETRNRKKKARQVRGGRHGCGTEGKKAKWADWMGNACLGGGRSRREALLIIPIKLCSVVDQEWPLKVASVKTWER